MTQPVFDQDSFRIRDEVGGLNVDANWLAAINTNVTVVLNTPFRIRFLIQETAGGMGANQTFSLWVSVNSGTYAEVPLVASSGNPVFHQTTTNYNNGDATSQVIGAGTYAGPDVAGGVEGAQDTGNIDYSGNDECEVEFCLEADSAFGSSGDTYDFRVRLSDGTPLTSHTNTPRVTGSNLLFSASVTGASFTSDNPILATDFVTDSVFGWAAGSTGGKAPPPRIKPLRIWSRRSL